MIPAGVELSSALFRLLLSLLEGEPTKDREILGGLTDSSAALIFAEAEVPHPVQPVGDLTVLPSESESKSESVSFFNSDTDPDPDPGVLGI